MAEDGIEGGNNVAIYRPGPLERFEAEEELAAGQYWRAVKPVMADEKLVCEAGTVLLVQSLRRVDGDIHTVVLAPHPEAETRFPMRMLLAEFHEHFERAHDWQSVRAEERARIEAHIQEIQQRLTATRDVALEISDQRNSPTVNALIARSDQADAVKNAVEVRREAAEKQAALIQAEVTNLTDATTVLSRFLQEQAETSLAAMEDTLNHAKGLQKGIETLGIFTGESVELRQLCEGDEAPSNEPIHFYQRKLYMDEEWLIHSLEGGADYTDQDDFAKALSNNPDLLRRILPQPRSVAVMAYRRREKEYFSEQEIPDFIARAYANAAENEGNRLTFLLIRNGDRVYQVFSELSTQPAQRLFPTQREVEALYKKTGFFRGEDATKITIQDIQFTDSRSRHDSLALFYRRLLILLWGLDQRERVFGDFYDRSDAPSWLSLEFQAENFRFVHDDENALEAQRLSFHEWMQEKNKYLAPGSRVVAVWEEVITERTAPGAYRAGSWRERAHDDRRIYRSIEQTGFAVARKSGDHIVVSVPCEYCSWNSDVKHKQRDIELRLDDARYYSESFGYLCLDAVRPEEIDYYLNSRREREGYLSYAGLFSKARDVLREEARRDAPFISALVAGIEEARLAASNEDAASAAHEAVRLWRAAHGAKALPAPAEEDYDAALRQVGAIAFTILGKAADNTPEIEEAIIASGRAPLRVSINGNGKIVAYATPSVDEEMPQDVSQAWVTRIPVTLQKRGIKLGTAKLVQMRKDTADEIILRQWDEALEWIGRRLPFKKADPDKLHRFFEIIESEKLVDLFMPEVGYDQRDLQRMLCSMEDSHHLYKEGGGTYVAHAYAYVPFGLLEYWRTADERADGKPPYDTVVLGFGAEIPAILMQTNMAHHVERWARDFYRKPDHLLSKWRDKKTPLEIVPIGPRSAVDAISDLDAFGAVTGAKAHKLFKHASCDLTLTGGKPSEELRAAMCGQLNRFGFGITKPNDPGVAEWRYLTPWADELIARHLNGPDQELDDDPKLTRSGP